MTIVDEISKNLVDPEKHGPILRALVQIMDEQGEKGLKDWITSRVAEILEELPFEDEVEN